MSPRRVIRDIARQVPHDLKLLRAKLMLEPLCETLGVEEVSCPACGGSGQLNRRALERCPLCCGFQEVPNRLAEWFKVQLHCAMDELDPGWPRGGRSSAALPQDAVGREPAPRIDGSARDIGLSVMLTPPAGVSTT